MPNRIPPTTSTVSWARSQTRDQPTMRGHRIKSHDHHLICGTEMIQDATMTAATVCELGKLYPYAFTFTTSPLAAGRGRFTINLNPSAAIVGTMTQKRK